MAYPLEYGDSPDTNAFNALNPIELDKRTLRMLAKLSQPAPEPKRLSPQREAHLQLHSRLADGSRCPQCNYLAPVIPPHDPSRCSECAEAEYRHPSAYCGCDMCQSRIP
jgi:hypothetical protein